jgi:hypothetical protein
VPDERTPREQARERIREFRRIVADAVGELRATHIRDSYAALSIEELMDQHVARLVDTNDATHLSRRQRVERVHTQLSENIEAIRETDPAQFRNRDPESDANTDPEPGA